VTKLQFSAVYLQKQAKKLVFYFVLLSTNAIFAAKKRKSRLIVPLCF